MPRPLAALLLAAASARAAAPAPAVVPGLAGLHVRLDRVRAGETLAALLKRAGTTRGTLEGLNQGTDLDALKAGDEVRILSAPGVFQKLHPGLTASDVARAYGIDPRELLAINGIRNPKRMPAGLELFIPEAAPLSPEAVRRLNRHRAARQVRVRGPRQFFGRPLPGEGRLVTSHTYGTRRNPFTGERQFHTGVDFVAPYGTPILAVRAGTVTFSGYQGGYGKLVILDHGGGYETYYGHASELLVRTGDAVTEGQTIARVGYSGDATGPHLHFEVRKGGGVKDPRPFLTRFL